MFQAEMMIFLSTRLALKKIQESILTRIAFTLSDPATTWEQWSRQKSRHYSTVKYYKPCAQIFAGVLFFFTFSFLSRCWQPAFIFFTGNFPDRFWVQAYCPGYCILSRMKKLMKRSVSLVLFFDIWMFFYYLIFAATI